MAMPPRLTVRLSAVTPLFLGGADPDARAELRPPSFKGLLRYWYRALDGAYREKEARFFGSTDTGQSPCLLHVDQWREGTERWGGWHENVMQGGRRVRRTGRYLKRESEGGFQRQNATTGKWERNGIAYLGYSLTLGANDRRAIAAGTKFTIVIQPKPGADSVDLRQAWLGALWALVHIGGVGSRSRRGLGSLRIDQWEGWPECTALQLPCQADNPAQWDSRMKHDLARLTTSWFDTGDIASRTSLGKGTSVLLLTAGHRDWEDALDTAGLALQDFRQRYPADYERIAADLAKQFKIPVTRITPEFLKTGPDRAGFGLPLAVRYSSLTYIGRNGRELPAETTFTGAEHDRMASPLFVRVTRLNQTYHPVFAHLPAPRLPNGERLLDEATGREVPWSDGSARIVRQFMSHIFTKGAVGVTLR